MANNKKRQEQDIFDSKIFFTKIIKRYGIILLISFVPIALLNYFVLKGISYTNLVLIDIALLLFACFIGLLIFTSLDKKREEKPKLKEDERDPFAD